MQRQVQQQLLLLLLVVFLLINLPHRATSSSCWIGLHRIVSSSSPSCNSSSSSRSSSRSSKSRAVHGHLLSPGIARSPLVRCNAAFTYGRPLAASRTLLGVAASLLSPRPSGDATAAAAAAAIPQDGHAESFDGPSTQHQQQQRQQLQHQQQQRQQLQQDVSPFVGSSGTTIFALSSRGDCPSAAAAAAQGSSAVAVWRLSGPLSSFLLQLLLLRQQQQQQMLQHLRGCYKCSALTYPCPVHPPAASSNSNSDRNSSSNNGSSSSSSSDSNRPCCCASLSLPAVPLPGRVLVSPVSDFFAGGAPLDEALLLFFKGPKSATGKPQTLNPKP